MRSPTRLSGSPMIALLCIALMVLCATFASAQAPPCPSGLGGPNCDLEVIAPAFIATIGTDPLVADMELNTITPITVAFTLEDPVAKATFTVYLHKDDATAPVVVQVDGQTSTSVTGDGQLQFQIEAVGDFYFTIAYGLADSEDNVLTTAIPDEKYQSPDLVIHPACFKFSEATTTWVDSCAPNGSCPATAITAATCTCNDGYTGGVCQTAPGTDVSAPVVVVTYGDAATELAADAEFGVDTEVSFTVTLAAPVVTADIVVKLFKVQQEGEDVPTPITLELTGATGMVTDGVATIATLPYVGEFYFEISYTLYGDAGALDTADHEPISTSEFTIYPLCYGFNDETTVWEDLCAPNGSCPDTSITEATCDCTDGYTGDVCETPAVSAPVVSITYGATDTQLATDAVLLTDTEVTFTVTLVAPVATADITVKLFKVQQEGTDQTPIELTLTDATGMATGDFATLAAIPHVGQFYFEISYVVLDDANAPLPVTGGNIPIITPEFTIYPLCYALNDETTTWEDSCAPNGSCPDTSITEATCACNDGYSGDLCEVEIKAPLFTATIGDDALVADMELNTATTITVAVEIEAPVAEAVLTVYLHTVDDSTEPVVIQVGGAASTTITANGDIEFSIPAVGDYYFTIGYELKDDEANVLTTADANAPYKSETPLVIYALCYKLNDETTTWEDSCAPNGSCPATSITEATCACNDGYSGDLCEVEIKAPLFTTTIGDTPLVADVELNTSTAITLGVPVEDPIAEVILTVYLHKADDSTEPVIIQINNADSITLTSDSTIELLIPAVGEYYLTVEYELKDDEGNVLTTADANAPYKSATPLVVYAACYKLNDETTVWEDSCAPNGSCPDTSITEATCACNDGYFGDVCETAMVAPTGDFSIVVGSEDPAEIGTDESFALADIKFSLAITGGDTIQTGSLTVYIVALDDEGDTAGEEEYTTFAWSDEALDYSRDDIELTQGGTFKLKVVYTIAGFETVAPLESNSFTAYSACWALDEETWTDTCGANGTCQGDGECLCAIGWAGDLCTEETHIPTAITIPSRGDLAITFTDDEGTPDAVIVHSGVQILVTFTPVENITPVSNIVVDFVYYPALTGTSYSTIPITISQSTLQSGNAEIELVLTTPQINSNKVEIRISASPVDEALEDYSYTTHTFTILPTCFTRPDNAEAANINKWTSVCQNNGVCGVNGACSCAEGFHGSLCEVSNETTPINECDMCDAENLKSCNPAIPFTTTSSPCLCNMPWGGRLCDEANDCLVDSLNACGYKNWRGVYKTIPGTRQCESECTCNNQWSGDRCGTCALKCENDGEAFRHCDTCGCQSGFSGANCQCHTALLSLTINGSNEIVDVTVGKYSGADGAFEPTNNLDVALQMLNDQVARIIASLLELSVTKVAVVSEPVTGGTKFTATVQYKCGASSRSILQALQATPFDEIQQTWTGITKDVPSEFVPLMTFNAAPSVIAQSTVKTENTLPTGDDRINGASIVSVVMVVAVAVLVALF